MNGLGQDFRYALRQLHKQPAFTTVAIVTLALAIGANTAIFSVVHAVLVAALPYPHLDSLVQVWGSNPKRGDLEFPVSAGDFTDWKQKNDVFEDLAASFDDEVTLTGTGEPRLVLGYAVTPNYLQILGVEPRMGRGFTEADADTHANVVVISDKLWHKTLHGDPQIVGKSLTLDSKPFTIIGVMPPGFSYPPGGTEIWHPFAIDHPDDYLNEHRFIRVIGRLKPGISVATAEARMKLLESQIAAQHPDTDAGNETLVVPLRKEVAGDVEKPLLALFAAVSLVLLIACVNIAGVLLARVASRRGEISVRAAIGASRGRLIQQFLCESLLLSLIGGVLGIGLARLATQFLLAIFPNAVANVSIPKIEAIPINAPVLWFSMGATLLTALLFGALPALQAARANANEALRESARSLVSRSQSSIRRGLVTAEIALSLVLLSAAGLMVESLRHVYQQDLGFRPEHVLALEVFLPKNRYPENPRQKRDQFLSSVMDRLAKLPGVTAVAATNFLPLTGFWGTTDFSIEGQSLPNHAEQPSADNRLITPNYFSTMGISLLRGRAFTDFDRVGSEQVAIVNATLARRYFGNEDPVGKVLAINDPPREKQWRIVGLVADVKAFGPEQIPHADLYRPLAQISFPLLAFTVRTSGDPAALLKPASQAIWEVDKDQPLLDALPMSQLAAQSVTLRRTSTILIASFATLALILAAVGLYGIMSYSVVQRSHEIGIRMALGAEKGDVLRMLIRNGLRMVVIGEIIGLIAALLLGRAVSTLVYGVSANDPRTLIAALGLLTFVALAASFIPAQRSVKVDPMQALRCE
jgi:putative ABC transport system permease protein